MKHNTQSQPQKGKQLESQAIEEPKQICQILGTSKQLAPLILDKIRNKEHFCSYELVPTDNRQVFRRFFNETEPCSPLFHGLAWHVTEGQTERFPSLWVSEALPHTILMHCTAKGLRRAEAEVLLRRALSVGIVNIFALQGDSGSEDGDFTYASDLVKFIRESFGNQFCICVAGYPEMHPHSPTKEHDLFYLKAKVDAGADIIITQFFFESQLFIQFVKDCRNVGITVPIIPGVYPFPNERLLNKITRFCNTNIPKSITDRLNEVGYEDTDVSKLGIDLSVKIIKEIWDSGASYGYHLYTLNRSQSAIEIHRQLAISYKY